MYFNLNVLPINKILHAGFTTTKQEKYCEISYPWFTEETEGRRLNNLSRQREKSDLPPFSTLIFPAPTSCAVPALEGFFSSCHRENICEN